jgi:S1-C subfamily serine protease
VAAEAGLQRGDVNLEINRERIRNTGDLQNTVSKAKPGANLLFLVRRGGNNLFLALKQPETSG